MLLRQKHPVVQQAPAPLRPWAPKSQLPLAGGVYVSKWAKCGCAFFFDLDLTAYNAVRLKTCPLLPRSQPASANSPPNWLNLNLCAAARFPSAPSSAARRAALAPAIPRLATVLTKA